MIASLATFAFLYFVVSLCVHGYHYVTLLSDASNATRHALFWPMYLARWLVTNFILAIKGR